MVEIKITRKDEDGETTKTFQDIPQYRALKIGDVVEVEHANGQLQDYYVTSTKWDFSHFGDTFLVVIEPQSYTPRAKMVRWVDGSVDYVYNRWLNS